MMRLAFWLLSINLHLLAAVASVACALALAAPPDDDTSVTVTFSPRKPPLASFGGDPHLRPRDDWRAYGRGVRWEASLDEAKARAAREGKPILLHQLVGDLDKEGC